MVRVFLRPLEEWVMEDMSESRTATGAGYTVQDIHSVTKHALRSTWYIPPGTNDVILTRYAPLSFAGTCSPSVTAIFQALLSVEFFNSLQFKMWCLSLGNQERTSVATHFSYLAVDRTARRRFVVYEARDGHRCGVGYFLKR